MSYFSYGQPVTHINGFLNYIGLNHSNLKINSLKLLNQHLQTIRLLNEPNKPYSKDVEKNAHHIQNNYPWKVVKDYFKSLDKTIC